MGSLLAWITPAAITSGQADEAHGAGGRLDDRRRRQADLGGVGAQQRETGLRRIRAQVLYAPGELVVADGTHVYAEVRDHLKASRPAREGSERPWGREIARVRLDDWSYTPEHLDGSP